MLELMAFNREFTDRRRSQRVRLAVRVSAGAQDSPVAIGQTRDISRHGLFIDLQLLSDPTRSFTEGMPLHLRFRPPNAETPLEVDCVVARVERSDNDHCRGIGVDFREMGERERITLDAFVSSESEPFDVDDA